MADEIHHDTGELPEKYPDGSYPEERYPAKYPDGSYPEDHGYDNADMMAETSQEPEYNPDTLGGNQYTMEPARNPILRNNPRASHLSPDRDPGYMGAPRISTNRVSFMGPRPSQFPTTHGPDNVDPGAPGKKKVLTPRQYIARRKVSTLAWWCFGFIILTLLVTLTIFVAPGWGRTLEIKGWEVAEGIMYGDYGLWFACWYLDQEYEWKDAHECALVADLKYVPTWYKGCQAMAVLAVISGVVSVSTISVYVYSMKFNKRPGMIAASAFFSIAAGLFCMILFIVFCVEFIQEAYWCCMSGAMEILQYELHYAFIMGCIATGFWFISAVLSIVEMLSLRQKSVKDRYMMRVASTRRGGPPPQVMNYGYGAQQPNWGPPQPKYGY